MNDSYSAARIQVMMTKLIKEQEYERLLKMSGMEIIGYLQSTEYRPDIDALSVRDLEDVENVDKILARNIDRTIAKLQAISSDEFTMALNDFLEENDMWNMRIIAEAIAGGSDPHEELKRYAKRGTFDPMRYAKATSIEELSGMASGRYKHLRTRPKTLAGFIDALLLSRPPLISTNQYLIDEQNIVRLLIYKRDRLNAEQIMRRMLRGGSLTRGILRVAASAGSVEETLKVLRSTKYADAMDDNILDLEYELHRAVLRRIKRASGISPLGPAVMVRYLVEKDLEAQNIRLLIKGKQLGLDEAFIRQQLSV